MRQSKNWIEYKKRRKGDRFIFLFKGLFRGKQYWIMNRQFFYGLLLSFLSLNLSLSALKAAEGEKRDRPAGTKILIVTQKSQFKEAVVSKITESLRKDGYFAKVINIKKLSVESTEDYQAIIIVNTCWTWRLNSHVRKFLKKVREDEKKKIVLLITGIVKRWGSKVAGVEAVTAASRMNKTGDIADAIINKVRILTESK